MASRIRTIKPEFFSSADIVSRTPLARLLYEALWCEADREGRLRWRPANFKLRYFPGDDCDVEVLAAELIEAGLVVLYGDGLAWIPTFTKHQHINPREAASALPAPDASARVVDASSRVVYPQGGREGNTCRTGLDDASVTRSGAAHLVRGARLPSEWHPTEEQLAWARKERPDIDVRKASDAFRDYWRGVPGAKGCKVDWPATFRNWIRNTHGDKVSGGNASTKPQPRNLMVSDDVEGGRYD